MVDYVSAQKREHLNPANEFPCSFTVLWDYAKWYIGLRQVSSGGPKKSLLGTNSVTRLLFARIHSDSSAGLRFARILGNRLGLVWTFATSTTCQQLAFGIARTTHPEWHGRERPAVSTWHVST